MIWTYIIQAFKWLIDPKNKKILIFGSIIMAILMFSFQCNKIKNLNIEITEQKNEKERIENNYIASKDVVKQYKTKNGNLRGEITGYKLTVNELNNKYDSLFGNYVTEKNKRPRIIIQTDIEIKDSITEVPIKVKLDSTGNGNFSFTDTRVFSDGNSRILNGTIPFQQRYFNKLDSTELNIDNLNIFSKPFATDGTFILKQNMKLYAGLSYNKKTKVPIIWIETKYPGITFTDIVGAEIMDDKKSKKALKQSRKTFGIGLSIGYGVNPNLKAKPYIGVGLNYTPKSLQW